MRQYITRRVLLFVPTLLIVSLLIFILLRIMPGDPALQLLLGGGGGGGTFTQQDLAALQKKLGTDKPLPVQYGTWLADLAKGDLGTSYWYNIPVRDQLGRRVPLTLELTALGVFISFVVAVPLGMVSALARGSIVDHIARGFSFIGMAIPDFVAGLLTVYVLARFFHWLPPLDYSAPWDDLGANLTQLIFPALALSFFTMAFIARITRSSLLEVLGEDYIRTARSKGLRARTVVLGHAMRNAWLPILTVGGWVFGIFLAGIVVIETIFVLPGMGTLLIDAIIHRDYAVIQGEVLVIAVMVLFVNLVIDLLYAWVDPRIRYT